MIRIDSRVIPAIAVALASIAGIANCSSNDSTASGGASAQGGSKSTASGKGSSNGGGSSTGGNSGSSGSASGGGGASPAGTPIAEFTGVNANIADSPDNLSPLGTVREYHNWGWIADNFAAGPPYPDMLYTFMNFNGWDWDVYFKTIQDQGGNAFPCVQGSVPWMNNSAIPPVDTGADPTAAASYVAHADAMFQIAARYGSVKVPDAKLKLKANQTRVSGLGTVQYFEDFNEQDNAAAFTPAAFAAMASADYDGDNNKLGDTFGVKNADPSAQLVMGGLSGKYPSQNWLASITAFLDGMRTWADANRGGTFPADVINVHYYSFTPDGGQSAPSPEDDGVKDKLAAVVAYRDQHLPGKQVWWTEFGYDTFAQSPLHAPALGPNSAFIVQAQWLIRDFLAALAAGIDRATLFELDDTCKLSDSNCHPEGQFVTCGLIDGTGAKKASWYFVATFRARLATMVFSGEQDSGQDDVSVYSFKDTKGKGGALVVWAPTSTGQTISNHVLTLPSGATTAKAVALVDQSQTGTETSLSVASGKVTLDVSETPTIVLVDSM